MKGNGYMKKISFLSLVLALTMLVSCSADKPSDDKETDDGKAEQEEVSTHLHNDLQRYPSTVDLADTETVMKVFDVCDVVDGIDVKVNARQKNIRLQGTVNGTKFTLAIDVSGSSGKTTPKQMAQCARLFWYCYPQMYARFAHSNTPTTVMLKFEDFGYEVASASGSEVHIHDQWLKDHPDDFDCLTHEFAHIIQGGWDGQYVPSYGDDTYMIERFADYCRYLYSYNRGVYNDKAWTLQTSSTEDTYYKSVRFWVWLDYTYSTKEIDIMNEMAQQIVKKDGNFSASHWEPDGDAWNTVFEGTQAYGKSIDQLWEEFASSNMAKLSSNPRREGEKSPLDAAYPLREAVRERYPESDDYLKIK